MRSLLNILAISMLFALVSCEKHENYGKIESDGNVNIILKCSKMEKASTTRALDQTPDEGIDTDYMVKDYWILQYTSSGDYIDGSAKYIEVSDDQTEYRTPVMLPQEGDAYYCLFMANTHNPELNKEFELYQSSLSEMTKFYKSISSLEDTYNATEGDLVMSGIAELTYGATELYCKLYRNIAKLTVELKNTEGSDLTIKSINIKNIPAGALYADALLKEVSLPGVTPVAAPFPTSYSLQYFNYELDELDVAEKTTKTLEWYLPRNFKGNVAEVTSADLKNKYAPELATYIEVFATTGNGELYGYKFYLGANATTNFDIEPNKHYTIPITFVDKGTVIDSRVSDYSIIELSDNSNCFIINPLPIERQAVYQLPINRVNEFWGGADAPAGEDHTITDNTNWVAEVIWQDQPNRIFTFVDASGNDADNFTGTGLTAFNFKTVIGAKGNVLVGIRKENETNYLWSWHLWITDYNPDNCTTPWITDKYVYFVPGGQVHRYAGEFWETNYENRYIMDRNLGALSANKEDGFENTGGYMYQYGRKDPFPTNASGYNLKLYKIDGAEFSISLVQEQTNIYNSVFNPHTFFGVSSGDWVKENPYKGDNYHWNDSSNDKSIFDPCPEGWTIPTLGTFEIFGEGNQMNYQMVITETHKQGVEFCIDAAYGLSHKNYNIAYFPALGNLHPKTGTHNKYAERGTYHSLNTLEWTKHNSFPMEFVVGNKSINQGTSSSKAKAANIRCVRERSISGGNDYSNNQNNEDYNQVPW